MRRVFPISCLALAFAALITDVRDGGMQYYRWHTKQITAKSALPIQ